MTDDALTSGARQDSAGRKPARAPGRKPGRNAILFIFITVLINMTGFGVIVPVMPQLIMEITGGTLAEAAAWGGYLSLSYASVQFIFMPVLGGLSDRFGRRPVILVSLVAYTVDFLVMAVAPTMTILLVARLLAGGFAATFSTANAYIADVSPPEKRAANFGLMGAAFGVGFVIGPALGGLVGEYFGPRAPFFTVAALGAINFVYGFFVLPETLKPENKRAFDWRRANAFGSFLQFRKYPIVLPIAGALFLYQIAHWSFPSVWAYFSEARFGWSPAQIGWSLVVVGLTSGAVQGGVTRYAVQTFGEARAAIFGIAVATTTFIGFAYVSTGLAVYVLIAIAAFASMTEPAMNGILSRTIPPDAQGELQGAVSAVSSLAMIIGPLFMTQTFAAFSNPGVEATLFGQSIPISADINMPGAPFFLAAVLTGLAIFPFMIGLSRAKRPEDTSGGQGGGQGGKQGEQAAKSAA
ncbi:MAG: TCR/Tet family MFS transporter [Pseudomonadota bacterium]